jgi:hypothetical protein
LEATAADSLRAHSVSYKASEVSRTALDSGYNFAPAPLKNSETRFLLLFHTYEQIT